MQVRGLAINRVFDSGPGVDLSTSAELTHFHFSGVMTANGSSHKNGLCGNVVADAFVDPWWVKDTVLADTVAMIKSCGFHNRTVRRGWGLRWGGWGVGLGMESSGVSVGLCGCEIFLTLPYEVVGGCHLHPPHLTGNIVSFIVLPLCSVWSKLNEDDVED